MYDVSPHGNNHTQDDWDALSVGIDCESPLSVITDCVDSSIYGFTADRGSSSPSQLLQVPNQFPQDFYDCYGINIEAIPEVCGDNFLQEYATKCGYQFGEDFLSAMNKNKVNFINKVDSIIVDLCGVVYGFLIDSEGDNTDIVCLMNRACSFFSRYVYALRPQCIDILQSDIVPVAIKIIFESRVIDSNSDRDMTYSEMEQLFLHFVTTLEKLVMVRMMSYWNSFFLNKKKYLLSLTPAIDYSDPFICAYHFDKVIPPSINCPAAFTNKFGECISFMAVSKIDGITVNFVEKCCDVLKKVVFYKCLYISDYSSDVCNDLERLKDALHDKFEVLIGEEFDKKIIEEEIYSKFNNFLNDLGIWKRNKHEIVKTSVPLIFDNIISRMRNLLVHESTNGAYETIREFKKVRSSNRCDAISGSQDGFIYPEDNYKIVSIRKKFYAKYGKVVRNNLRSMIKGQYKFLNVKSVEEVDWDKFLKRMYPLVQESVEYLIREVHSDLYKFIFDVRVFDSDSIFDGSSYGTRSATPEERDKIFKISIEHIRIKNKELFGIIWENLISKTKSNISKDVGLGSNLGGCEKSTVFTTDSALVSTVSDGSLDDTTSEVQGKLPVLASSSRVPVKVKSNKIIDMWGLNIHPDDDRSVLLIRRKFSNRIRDHLIQLFSDILKNRAGLMNGKDLSDSSLFILSSDLQELAMKSVCFIIEKQYDELDVVLSMARVVEVNVDNFSSFMIRKVTDDEKKNLITRSRSIIDKRLKAVVKLSWLHVVNEHSEDIGYVYKEKSKSVSGISESKCCKVRLRYSDKIAITEARKKYSSMIKTVVYDKFSSMLSSNYRFDDNTPIGAVSWFKLHKKLLPVAKEEIKSVLEDQKEELGKIISRSRVVVGYKVDRELTSEENSFVFESIMNTAYHALKSLFRRVWEKVIVSLRDNFTDTSTSTSPMVGGGVGVSPSSVNVPDVIEEGLRNKNDGLKVKLCYEDDNAILSIRRRFSSEIYSCISNKFSEMVNEKHRFDDGTTVGVYSWKEVSGKIFPIVNKVINPIIEKEREKIDDMLSKSRVSVNSPDNFASITTRELTPKERSAVLGNVMEAVYKNIAINLNLIWNRTTKSLPPLRLLDLEEVDRSELDNIRSEFSRCLVLIVDEFVDSLSSDAGTNDTISDMHGVAFERSHNLLNEGGFLNRIESLLSNVRVLDMYGNNRFINDEEQKSLLKEFMDMIGTDRNSIIKECIGKFNKSHVLAVDLSPELSVGSRGGHKHHNNSKHRIITADSVGSDSYDHSYSKASSRKNKKSSCKNKRA